MNPSERLCEKTLLTLLYWYYFLLSHLRSERKYCDGERKSILRFWRIYTSLDLQNGNLLENGSAIFIKFQYFTETISLYKTKW
jgi:hypothetical protein